MEKEEKRVKRLLILAYDFPPYVSVGGLRPYAWYKYLHEFGVYPIVITRQWGNEYGDERDYVAPSATNKIEIEKTEYGTIVRAPYKPNVANRLFLKYKNQRFVILRSIISAFYNFVQYRIPIGPKSCVYRAAKWYLKNNQVDAIITTVDPYVLLKYASKLSRKYNIKWIADYRDLWKQKIAISESVRLERKLVSSATYITTVNSYSQIILSQLSNKPLGIITNGYNDEAVAAVSHIPQENQVLRFAYCGTIYSYHPFESVMSAFNEFAEREDKPQFELNFFGINNPEYIEKLIVDKFQALQSHITITPRMANADLLKELATHNVFLLFNDFANPGTKIYDYMALKRQILLCYSNDAECEHKWREKYPMVEECTVDMSIQSNVITKTDSGVVAVEKTDLLQILNNLYLEFRDTHKIACNSHNYEQYSRRTQTQKLAEIIQSL